MTFTFLGAPAAVYQRELDRVMCFVKGVSPKGGVRLYNRLWDGQKWVWEDHKSPPGQCSLPSSSPSAIYQTNLNRVICFLFGDDGHLYDTFWDGQAWVWEDHGIPPGSSTVLGSPSALYQASLNRVICFVIARGFDGKNRLHFVFWNGHSWEWQMPSGAFQPEILEGSSPSAVYQSSSQDRVTCFVVGKDGHLYNTFWNGKSWEWQDQGEIPGVGHTFSNPSAVYQKRSDRLVCFVSRGTELNYRYWDGVSWHWAEGYNETGDILQGTSPSAVYQPGTNRVVCFFIDRNRNIDYLWYSESLGRWTANGPIGVHPHFSPLTAPSAVLQDKIDRLVCFAHSNDDFFDVYWRGDDWIWDEHRVPA